MSSNRQWQRMYQQTFCQLCKHSGIIHQTTVPYSPDQNGLAERIYTILTERARSMLSYMQVEELW